MKPGIYRHRERTELLYLFIGLAQEHDTHAEVVVYVPLFSRSGWEGTPVMTYRALENFQKNFEWVGERQPEPSEARPA
jgi:hypothetical protein